MSEYSITPIISYDNMNPDECLNMLLDNTDYDGVLYVTAGAFEEPDRMYRCRMDWNISACTEVSKEFNELYENLKVISCVEGELDGTLAAAERLLENNKAAIDVWNKYIRPFHVENIDASVIGEIEERIETIDWVKDISARFSKGEIIKEYEKEVLKDSLDVTVSDEERVLVRKYYEGIIKDSESRVGKTVGAYDEVIRAKRVCKLMSLGAPDIVLNAEACMLAQSMAIHRFALTRDVIYKNNVCFTELTKDDCDEAFDDLYRPKKANSRKSMIPLFVYLILKENSSAEKHLRQKEIIEILKKCPYEISVERKALGRTIHNLEDSGLSVFCDETGTWVE